MARADTVILQGCVAELARPRRLCRPSSRRTTPRPNGNSPGRLAEAPCSRGRPGPDHSAVGASCGLPPTLREARKLLDELGAKEQDGKIAHNSRLTSYFGSQCADPFTLLEQMEAGREDARPGFRHERRVAVSLYSVLYSPPRGCFDLFHDLKP